MRFRVAACFAVSMTVCLSTQIIFAADSSSAKSSTLLKTSAKDDEQMNQSVKVMVAPPPSTMPSALKRATLREVYRGYQPPPPPKIDASASAAPEKSLHERLHSIFAQPAPSKTSAPLKWDYTATPSNGVMNWAPGYSVTELPRPVQRRAETSMQFSTNQSRMNALMEARNKQLKAQRAVQQVLPGPTEMKATQLALPKAKALPPTTNWEQWYSRVARAIYEQWKQNSVGPGEATVLITAYNTHDVDCRITDFTAAEDVKRDAATETRFKQAALSAVSSLSGDDIWSFPLARTTPKKVSFDMQFKHAVGEKNGCQVVHVHDESQI